MMIYQTDFLCSTYKIIIAWLLMFCHKGHESVSASHFVNCPDKLHEDPGQHTASSATILGQFETYMKKSPWKRMG